MSAQYYPELAERVTRQADDLPELYGDFDFTTTRNVSPPTRT
ncbi:hypothetical protein [Gordonia westfalica]|uniref:Uncharacterized protein n=1 Tax=Gordonia westfalica TaxID=158898 RepID=A0A1H2GY81_9ACTN|nr:hypothetical protein SAMN04488548_134175 [Gordonia westfalica]